MSRITEYAIITGKDSQDLATKVNEKLATGWRPKEKEEKVPGALLCYC